MINSLVNYLNYLQFADKLHSVSEFLDFFHLEWLSCLGDNHGLLELSSYLVILAGNILSYTDSRLRGS